MPTQQQDLSKAIKISPPELNIAAGTILLPINKALLRLPGESVTIDEIQFSQKPEVHVTLVGRKVGELLTKADGGLGLVFDSIRRIIDETPWSISQSSRYIQLHKVKPIEGSIETIDARSIIELVNIAGAEDFYRKLSKIVGTEVLPPPLHMTIFTNTDPEGIGVASEADLLKYREKDIRSLR